MASTTPSPDLRTARLEVGLDFANTLEHSKDDDREHLPDGAALLAWLIEHEVMPPPIDGHAAEQELRAADEALGRARRLRFAIRALVEALVERREPDDQVVSELDGWLRRPGGLRLIVDATGIRVVPTADQAPVREALSHLALAVAQGIADGDPRRLRICDNHACRWLFYDTSRPGTRRWCDMTVCGNRAKAKRHRERARAIANQAEPGPMDAVAMRS